MPFISAEYATAPPISTIAAHNQPMTTSGNMVKNLFIAVLSGKLPPLSSKDVVSPLIVVFSIISSQRF